MSHVGECLPPTHHGFQAVCRIAAYEEHCRFIALATTPRAAIVALIDHVEAMHGRALTFVPADWPDEMAAIPKKRLVS